MCMYPFVHVLVLTCLADSIVLVHGNAASANGNTGNYLMSEAPDHEVTSAVPVPWPLGGDDRARCLTGFGIPKLGSESDESNPIALTGTCHCRDHGRHWQSL